MVPCHKVCKAAIALTFTSVILFANPAYSQAPNAQGNLETEVSAVKAENAAVREQLKTMQEQQKALAETIDRLQRELGGPQAAGASAGTPRPDRYQDGIVIWQTPDTEKFPFLVKYNQDIQLRYLNTLNGE